MKVETRVLPPAQFDRSTFLQSNPQSTSPQIEKAPTSNLDSLQIRVQDTLQLGAAEPNPDNRTIGQLNEALQSLKQLTNSGANASDLSVLQRFQSETLPKNIAALKVNQRDLQEQMKGLPVSAPERKNLALQLQVVNESLAIFQQAARLLANSPLFQKNSVSTQTTDADEQKAIAELTNLSLDQVTPANFERLDQLLATYNQSKLSPKPPLSQDLVNNLETLFLNEASQREPAEQTRLLSMLPGIDANDLLLVQARGSLGILGQLKASQGDISQVPPALQQTLVNQLNQTLKMSGSTLQVEGLEDSKVTEAVQELEKQLGLPVTGDVTVENLREIEKTQKNLYVIMTNARNILYDEILPAGEDKVQTLESLLGKGDAINQKEALNHVRALRQKYFWLTDKQIPEDKLSPELYADTMKARQNWLNENREIMGQSQTFLLKEASMVKRILAKQGGEASFSQLEAMANNADAFTLQERAALQKLVQNSKVYDYVWSIEVGDKNKDGKLDGPLTPSDRSKTTLTVNKLQEFSRAIARDFIDNGGDTGSKTRGIRIPAFYDGRIDAAKIYDAGKVSGDEWFSWTGLGAGTNEEAIKTTLQNAQASRGKLIALKRDYERMYETELKNDVQGEFSGGELGENLAYVNSAGEDWIAEQEIGTAERAELLLAKFKPQIDQIGADNGPIAWAVGHSSDDDARQQELLGLYDQAQRSLAQWKANPKDAQAEKELMTLTSKVLIRLQADQQADSAYSATKDEAVAVTKTVAIVAAATVATVATGGAGAPALLAAVAAGTAAGTTVAVIGEAADQVGDYIGESNRNAIATNIAQEQQQAVSEVDNGDDAFKTQILRELDTRLEGLEREQADRKVFDREKLLNATYEGFKTSLITSGMTVATMGLSQLGGSAKIEAAFAAMGKSGNITRMALINGISGAAGDVAGKIISPLKLNTTSSPEKVAEVVGQMEQHLSENRQLLNELEKQKETLQAQISAFNQKYQPVTPDSDTGISLVQTVKLEPPSEAETKALMTAQIQLQEIEKNIGDLTESNKRVGADIQKIKDNAGNLFTWDSAEWAAVSENLGRNLAISFVAGAALNLVGGKSMVSRIAFNSGSSAAETIGNNAIAKYVDGKDNQELWDGVIQNVLTSTIAGEASNMIQNRQAAKMGLNSTAEGRLMQQLQIAEKSPTTGHLSGLLKEAGFIAEAPETHGPAVAKVLQSHPEFSAFVNSNLRNQRMTMAQEFSNQIGETAQKSHPQADAEKTVTRFWEAQEQIYLLEQQKQRLADTPDSPEKTTRLGELDSQQNGWKQTAEAIARGKQAVDSQGHILGEKIPTQAKIEQTAAQREKRAIDEEGDLQRVEEPNESPDKLPVTDPDVAIKPLRANEPSQRTRELASRIELMAQADPAGLQKIQQVLDESAPDITDEIKAEFLSRVESRLKDPHFQGKSVFEVMKSVVKDDPASFTKKGQRVPLSALQAEGTFSRVVTMTAVYREYLRDGARQQLKDQFGITNDKEFAARVKEDPSLFSLDMLNPEALISGGNETGWWTPKGQSEAKTTSELAQEVAVDPKRFEAGTLRLSIEPKALYDLGLRKPTALDGMFEEWREVGADEALGRTDGNKSEGVISGIPLNKMGNIEVFSAQGRVQLNLETVERSQRLKEAVALRGGKPEWVEAGQKKIKQILNEAASGITAEIKAEFFKRVEVALQDPKYNDKSVFEVMQKVVSDDPKRFTKQGERIPLEALKAEGTFTRTVTMTAVYREFMSDATRLRLKNEFGITNDKQFAAQVKKDPSFFGMDLVDPHALISGGNETGWWAVKGQSEAQNTEALAQELAVDPERYEAGTLRFSIEPEVMYQAGARKPTALDGMFKEWVDVSPDQLMGKTEGNKSEGVVYGVPLQHVGSIEYFTKTARVELNIDD